jgi:predicted acyl esterase
MRQTLPQPLNDAAPDLARILERDTKGSAASASGAIRRETAWVSMRDGVRLATDLYFPLQLPAPAIAVRTPYSRADNTMVQTFLSLANKSYVVIAQDCRGTGDSEPDSWDYYVYEREDSFDLVEWVTAQEWFNGFLGACGGSYLAQTQWCMALHPQMSAIAPEVGGLGIAHHTARHYMFLNAYSRAVGKGSDKVPISYQDLERQMVQETLAGGFFNEPLHRPFTDGLIEFCPPLATLPPSVAKHWLWQHYCRSSPLARANLIKHALGESTVTAAGVEALPAIFGQHIAHDAHMFPCERPTDLCRALHAPALMVTGWYDWGLNDALATWTTLQRDAEGPIRSRSRLLITPGAHNMPGYHEGRESHPELDRTYRTADLTDLLLRWYEAIGGNSTRSWPPVIYYLMGANEWYAASHWPPLESRNLILHLGPNGSLTRRLPEEASAWDRYIYCPENPTPTVGGSIVSYVYRPGSADVSQIQDRADVLTYTTEPLGGDLDLVGPLRLVLYASSSAVDTDFAGRLTDVFPDGRAIQLQNGILRARHRNSNGSPELLEPGCIYRLEIDMWATANRFKAGHRIRVDISSADFPRFDRNANRGGNEGGPVTALQTIYRDVEHPSCLITSVIGEAVIRGDTCTETV